MLHVVDWTQYRHFSDGSVIVFMLGYMPYSIGHYVIIILFRATLRHRDRVAAYSNCPPAYSIKSEVRYGAARFRCSESPAAVRCLSARKTAGKAPQRGTGATSIRVLDAKVDRHRKAQSLRHFEKGILHDDKRRFGHGVRAPDHGKRCLIEGCIAGTQHDPG
jgi:hypothetical protein